MATSTIAEDREALRAVIQAAVPSFNVHAYWPDAITTPAILIKPGSRRLESQDGAVVRRYEVEILLNAGSNRDAQITLDELLEEDGVKSLRTLIEGNPTLDGAVEYAVFVGWRSYGGHRTETMSLVGTVCEVDIYA